MHTTIRRVIATIITILGLGGNLLVPIAVKAHGSETHMNKKECTLHTNKSYKEALKLINNTYKTSQKDARSKLKIDLAVATTKVEKTTAQKAYKQTIDVAKEKMQTDKKATDVKRKTDLAVCK